MQNQDLLSYVYEKIGKSKIYPIKPDASLRKYYRISNNKKTFILVDSSKENLMFNNMIKVNKILSKVKISIPKIFFYNKRKKFMIIEDFGKNRFDKIIHKNKYTNKLFSEAILSLAEIKNTLIYDKKNNLSSFNNNKLKQDISEFIEWYYPHIFKKKLKTSEKNIFYNTWKSTFKKVNLNSDTFVHGDFFCNNLMYLSNKKQHLQCGIIDYQDAFWGDTTFDLVSLLEDSRRVIKTYDKDFLIDLYLAKTNQKNNKENLLLNYNFLGAARQTRILGRWIKLSKIKKNHNFLKFLNTTWHWLEINLHHPSLFELKKLYDELVPLKFRKYDS
tara:strand:- start:831 stop:1820 length:990 start_codon:yes stop_codon:yes gene_type:complete